MRRDAINSRFIICVLILLPMLVPCDVYAQGITTRVSVSSAGVQGNGASYNPSISSDGRFVTFDSDADNLVAGDTNGAVDPYSGVDIFVHDRQTGQTTRVSVSSAGVQGNGACYGPSISSDGRFVAFESDADNLVDGDTNGDVFPYSGTDIFVHDRQTGQTTRVSVSSAGVQGDRPSSSPKISSWGRYAAFDSYADNLVAGDTSGDDDPNSTADVFVHDRQTVQTTRVSVSSTGAQGNERSKYPSISSDGRFVAFRSEADNLVDGDTNNANDIFIHDRQTAQTTRVSVSSAGMQGNSASYNPSISSDGRIVAFESEADNLVDGDTNGDVNSYRSTDIFIHDRQTVQTSRVSVSSAGIQANGISFSPSISSDGRFVAFDSDADNLVVGDSNNSVDVFVHERLLPDLCECDFDGDGDVDGKDLDTQTAGETGIALESFALKFGKLDCS